MFFKLILLCLGLCLAYFVRFRRKRARLYELMGKFQGPPGIPILGNVFDFKSDPVEAFEHLRKNYFDKFKDTFKIWLVHIPFVVIFKPEDIRILSTKSQEKDIIYQYLTELMGDGLLTCSMEKWRRRRRIVNPAFQMPYLVRNVLGTFNEHYFNLSVMLKKECDNGKEFDLWPYLVSSTFQMICETTMGRGHGEDLTEIEKFWKALDKSTDLIYQRISRPWLYPSFIYTIYKYLTGQAGVLSEAIFLPQKTIKERKQGVWPKKTDREGNEIKDLVDMVGEASGNSQYMDDQEMTDEILTVLLTGTDTVAVTSSFNFLMLAMKPEVQDKVIKELEEIFGDSERLPTADDLNKMVYLDQCLKETLRWVSEVPILFRTSNEEIQLSDGRIIPGGATIAISLYMVHHDETIFPQPYTWNPDNFLPEKTKNRHPNSFNPFGIGLRTCLGSKYAMVSMKVLQSTILRKYKLRTSLKEEDVKLKFDFLIHSAHGYPVQLEYRKPQH